MSRRQYRVKEMFYSLQGEGARAGRPAVFLRFAGCNLWSGREQHRASATCTFCDTDFVGTDGRYGDTYTHPTAVAAAVYGLWQQSVTAPTHAQPYVVCTGGEPLLQLDAPLIAALQARGFEVAIETNGTLRAPAAVDWITVSPKEGAPWTQKHGDELKLVYPQHDLTPAAVSARVDLRFAHYYLQPMDCPQVREHTAQALAYCLAHPQWRLSLQMHKILHID